MALVLSAPQLLPKRRVFLTLGIARINEHAVMTPFDLTWAVAHRLTEYFVRPFIFPDASNSIIANAFPIALSVEAAPVELKDKKSTILSHFTFVEQIELCAPPDVSQLFDIRLQNAASAEFKQLN